MKIPQVVGRNKIRDAKILRLWMDGNHRQKKLAEMFNLTVTRIGQIIYTNSALLKFDIDYEKHLRIIRLKQEIKGKPKSNKDVADLMEQLRKELEGDKPLIDNSKVTHISVKVVRDNGTGFRDTVARQPNEGSRI